ncbi:MAG: hypothetical protein KatS3mg102_2419 [Planctomycetota bacterium]|nr:MAG: hypothetical protein KatS3mg102_2419 [Planctomycetota bacterium]
MQARLAALVLWLARRPLLPLMAAAALLALSALGAARVQVAAGTEALHLEDDPALPALRRLTERFGEDELVIVALAGEVLSPAGLERLDALTAELAALDGVAQALSITNAQNIYHGPLEVYGWAPYEWVRDGEWSVEQFRQHVLAEPLFTDNLIARDGSMAAVLVWLEHADAELLDAIAARARAAAGEGFATHVSGFPVQRLVFARLIREDQARFVPLLVGMIALLAFSWFRHPWGALIPLAMVALATAFTLALAWLLGKQLNMVTSLLTPVVMVVSVTLGMNLCLAFAVARRRFRRGATAISAAYRHVGLACLFTTLTTVLGFGGLALAEVPAIRDFGLLAAAGIAFSYLAALLVLPGLFGLRWRHGPQALRSEGAWLERWLGRLAPWAVRRRHLTLVLTGALLAAAVAGALRLRVETDIIGQLPPAAPLTVATRAIDARLGGVNAVELLVEGPPGSCAQLPVLAALAALRDRLAARAGEGIGRVFSAVDVLERLHAVKRARRLRVEPEALPRTLPDDAQTLAVYLGLLRQSGSASPVARYLAPDGSAARVTVRVRELPSSRAHALLGWIERTARELLPAGIQVHATGQFVLLQNMTHVLPRAQLRGIALAAGLIVLAIGLLFGSLRLAVLAAVPAAVPIACTYGLMGWAAIPLSTATSMIAAVVLGLAVDSTILFLAHYRERFAAGAAPAEATRATLLGAGRLVTSSNLTLVGGFAVCALSGFPPVRTFGLLAAVTIGMSYLAAILLLPALVHTPGLGLAPPRGGAAAASIPC